MHNWTDSDAFWNITANLKISTMMWGTKTCMNTKSALLSVRKCLMCVCMKPHGRWVSATIKSRHAGLNRLHCIELLFLWCISDRPQRNAQNPEGLCTTQRQPAQGRPDRCAAAMPSCVYLWAVEFVIPLCNAMTGNENDLLWSAVVFVKYNVEHCCYSSRHKLWEMGMVQYRVTHCEPRGEYISNV